MPLASLQDSPFLKRRLHQIGFAGNHEYFLSETAEARSDLEARQGPSLEPKSEPRDSGPGDADSARYHGVDVGLGSDALEKR